MMPLTYHLASIPSPFKHPFTGVEHVRKEDGSWVPPMDIQPSPVYTRWVTRKVPVPEKDRDEYLQAMISVAKGLSQATGIKIEWHYIKDGADNCFGDWGCFKVTH